MRKVKRNTKKVEEKSQVVVEKTRIPDARYQYLDHWYQNTLPLIIIGEWCPAAPVKRLS